MTSFITLFQVVYKVKGAFLSVLINVFNPIDKSGFNSHSKWK